jgi:hypothetical protein
MLRRICFSLIAAAPLLVAQTAPSPSIEARIRAIEDTDAIQRVLLNYGRYLDARQFKAYSELFAKNGEWTGGFGTVKGPAAIQAFMEKNIGAGPAKTATYHLLSNFLIEVNGTQATAWSRWAYVVPGTDGKPSVTQGGHYQDTLIQEAGHWKFQRRIAFTDIPHNDPTEKK